MKKTIEQLLKPIIKADLQSLLDQAGIESDKYTLKLTNDLRRQQLSDDRFTISAIIKTGSGTRSDIPGLNAIESSIMILFQLDANYIQRFISILNTYCQLTNSYKATVTDDMADDPMTPAVTYEYQFKWGLAVPNGTPYDVSVKVTNEPGITQETIQMEQVVLTGSVIYSDVLKLDDEEIFIEVPGTERGQLNKWADSGSATFLAKQEKSRMTLPFGFSFSFRKVTDFGTFDNLAIAVVAADEYVTANGGSTVGLYWRATANMPLVDYSIEGFSFELLDKNAESERPIGINGWLIIVKDDNITGPIRHVLFKVVDEPDQLIELPAGNILPHPDLYPLNFGVRIERESPVSPPEDPFYSYYGEIRKDDYCILNGITESAEDLSPAIETVNLIEEERPEINIINDSQSMSLAVVRIPGDYVHDWLLRKMYEERSETSFDANIRQIVRSIGININVEMLIGNIKKIKQAGFEYITFAVTRK
jgi:hypothetical protein